MPDDRTQWDRAAVAHALLYTAIFNPGVPLWASRSGDLRERLEEARKVARNTGVLEEFVELLRAATVRMAMQAARDRETEGE